MRRLIEASHLDLCCLQKPIIIACGSEKVKDCCDDLVEYSTFAQVDCTSPNFENSYVKADCPCPSIMYTQTTVAMYNKIPLLRLLEIKTIPLLITAFASLK